MSNPDAPRVVFTDKELAAWRKEYAAGATDEQFNLWIADCERRGLIPVKDVVLQIRTANEWDPETRSKVRVKRPVYITTIAALRKLAERTGRYAGQAPSEWIYLDTDGNPTIVSKIPLPSGQGSRAIREPWIARAFVLRTDFNEPMVGLARFGAYAQTYKDGQDVKLNSTWSTRGPEQLEKCAIAGALRAAFPDELQSLYVSEELPHETDSTEAPDPTPVVQATTEPPKPTAIPAVDHTPAQGKDEPRPGERKEKQPKRSTAKKSGKEEPAPDKHLEEQGKAQAAGAHHTGNIHGLDVTDNDLPDFDAPPAKAEPAPEPDRAPTQDEKTQYAQKLRGYNADKEKLKAFICKFNGVDNWTKLGVNQWTKTFQKLDSAVDEKDLTAMLA